MDRHGSGMMRLATLVSEPGSPGLVAGEVIGGRLCFVHGRWVAGEVHACAHGEPCFLLSEVSGSIQALEVKWFDFEGPMQQSLHGTFTLLLVFAKAWRDASVVDSVPLFIELYYGQWLGILFHGSHFLFFALFQVKHWSKLLVFFLAFLFWKFSFSLQKEDGFQKKTKIATKNTMSKVKNWSNCVAQHTWTSL